MRLACSNLGKGEEKQSRSFMRMREKHEQREIDKSARYDRQIERLTIKGEKCKIK